MIYFFSVTRSLIEFQLVLLQDLFLKSPLTWLGSHFVEDISILARTARSGYVARSIIAGMHATLTPALVSRAYQHMYM